MTSLGLSFLNPYDFNTYIHISNAVTIIFLILQEKQKREKILAIVFKFRHYNERRGKNKTQETVNQFTLHISAL